MDPHLPPSSSSHAAAPRLESLDAEPLLTRDYEMRPALFYERLRARFGPVAPVDILGVKAWMVLGYQEVLEVLRNESRWKKDPKHWKNLQEGRIPDDHPLVPPYRVRSVLMMEGQEHKRTRGALDAAMRPFQDPGEPEAAELEAVVARHADELITVFAESTSGTVDLASQFARPLPLLVINRLFGFPVEQDDDIVMNSWRLVDSGPDAPEAAQRLLAAMTELLAYKKENPGDDLTSRLIAEAGGIPDELIVQQLFVVLPIVDAISSSITNGVLEVLTGNTAAEDSLTVGSFHELVNRVHITSAPWPNLAFRFAAADTVLGNYRIAAGDPVCPSAAAAHGDPIFAKALRDDGVTSTRAHLAWGAGAHQCPARDMAETVATIALGRLFDRCDLEMTLPVDQIPWRSSLYARGVRALPVRYRMRQLPGEAAQLPVPPPPSEPPAPAQPTRPRSRLWRFLASLRGGGHHSH